MADRPTAPAPHTATCTMGALLPGPAAHLTTGGHLSHSPGRPPPSQHRAPRGGHTGQGRGGRYYCRLASGTILDCTLHCNTHCTVLHPELHCSVHCTALHCTALHHTTLHCTTLHCTTLHCTTLHSPVETCVSGRTIYCENVPRAMRGWRVAPDTWLLTTGGAWARASAREKVAQPWALGGGGFRGGGAWGPGG